MSDVSEPGTARGKVGNDREGLLDGEMHGVGVVAESVENQVVEIEKQRTRGVGEGGEVSEISGATYAEAENLLIAVDEWDGDEVGGVRGQGIERAGDGVEGDLGNGAEGGKTVEDVGKGAAEDGLGVVGGEDGHGRFLAHVEGADVVEAKDVVSVRVGEDQSVEALEAGAKSLRAEVGSGVHDDVAAGMCDEKGGTSAVVARVGGAADAALAAERGNAHGGAGAENGKAERASRVGHGASGLALGLLFHGLSCSLVHFEVTHFELAEKVEEETFLVGGKITESFFAESVEHVDHLAGALEVEHGLAGAGVGITAKHHGGVAGDEVHEKLEAAQGFGGVGGRDGSGAGRGSGGRRGSVGGFDGGSGFLLALLVGDGVRTQLAFGSEKAAVNDLDGIVVLFVSQEWTLSENR